MKRTILEAAGAPHSFRELAGTVRKQAFWICVGYLSLGSLSEVLRRWGMPAGVKLQRFLDGMSILVIELTGIDDAYLNAIGSGRLSPFWNRCALSSLTALLIFVQALLLGCAFSAFFLWLERRLSAGGMASHQRRAADGDGNASPSQGGDRPE